MNLLRVVLLAAVSLLLWAPALASAAPKTQMIEVEPGVMLEVEDWGGSGRAVVFLAGFGWDFHAFDAFADQFTDHNHIYSITRRGFGASSHPKPTDENYTVGRLAEDVLAVDAKLGLVRPVLVGHSVAGQELSEIGATHPELVSGLIYLEAANSQAYFGPHSDVLYPIAGEVRANLARLISAQPSEARQIIAKLRAELPRLQRGLGWYESAIDGAPDNASTGQTPEEKSVQDAVIRGARVHGPVSVPVLSIAADPPACEPNCASRSSLRFAAQTAEQTTDFSQANPSAVVLRLPHADHFIWKSNSKEVVTAMRTFLKKLPPETSR